MTTDEPRPAPDGPVPDGPAREEPAVEEQSVEEQSVDPAGADSSGADGADGEPLRLRAAEISRLTAGSTRRAPRYGRFIGVGVLVGVALAAIVALLGPAGPVLGKDAVFLLLALGLGTAGAVLGGLSAVVAERRRG